MSSTRAPLLLTGLKTLSCPRDIWSNEWSDPVYFDFKGIDPSIFFDDDGRAYIQGSAAPGPMTKIHLFEIDLQTGKKLSEEKKIWDGTSGIYPEGPHIYKQDGLYYLLIFDEGTHDGHMVAVTRSKTIWGPDESLSEIQSSWRTARMSTYNTRDVATCSGTKRASGGVSVWLYPGEWPSLTRVKINPVLPDGSSMVREGRNVIAAESPIDLVYIRDAKLSDHQLSSDAKTITLTPTRADLSHWEEPVTFVGKRQRQLDGRISVKMYDTTVPGAASTSSLRAGLACYKDEHRYARTYYDFASSEIAFEVVNKANSIARVSRQPFQLRNAIVLRIEYNEVSYPFSVRQDDKESSDWVSTGSLDTLEIMGPDFVGPIIGVFAVADEPEIRVRFEDLKVE
ncbi:hypothetical protein VTO42DRAFT_957 [Malbranchea cinnamomea]